jgi:hypothetical protein
MVFCGLPDRRALSVHCALFLYTLIERMRAEFYMSFHCGPSARTGRGGLAAWAGSGGRSGPFLPTSQLKTWMTLRD